MNQPQDTNAWSLYWSEDRLYSCVAQSSDEDQKVLNKLWQGFSQELEPNSRVLDLATGNGAVADALLSVNSALQVDAVDKASIDPKKFLKEHGNLLNVNFHGDTDIFDLSFKPSTFDAITSQFGIEYAGLTEASVQVLRYLKVAGRFQFVVHHAQSGIILSSSNKIVELEQLTQQSGILETLIKVLGGKAEFSTLEALGQDYLKQDLTRSEQISGQVFAGIERIINGFASQPKESLELAVAMDLRVRSELTRLGQLITAGQTSDSMTSWLEKVSTMGVEAEFSPLYLDPIKQDYLLGWLATGVRSK
jgi:ubiquinone/menaquinone biosynthesis C-methylase UbiE